MDIEKQLARLQDRLTYIKDILGGKESEHTRLLAAKFADFTGRWRQLALSDQVRQLAQLEDIFRFLEKKLDDELTPMDKVRIVRHPQRVCLKDILENVYDNYSEIGGQDEYSIDPAVVIARAILTRRIGKKVIYQMVMVIGQEKGHGQEFRNGGSVKPWGNAKALKYMRVAQTENIPIHSYIFTPGAYPVEDYPGAAQQIARNLYEMAGLTVPIVSVFSEGGSGGAEAIGLADRRLMLSHGYYSVISPEGAAAIEAKIRQGQRVAPEVIEKCARDLKMTAQDNLHFGYVDHVIQEPPLGARPDDYEFFKTLRAEMIRATNEVVLSVKGLKLLRTLALRRHKRESVGEAENVYVNWQLSSRAREELVWRRWQKFRHLAQRAFSDRRSMGVRSLAGVQELTWSVGSYLRDELLGKRRKHLRRLVEDAEAEIRVVSDRVVAPVKRLAGKLTGRNGNGVSAETAKSLTELSNPEAGVCLVDDLPAYVSPKAATDRSVSCPNAASHGCPDLWAPDLFGDFGGVCSHCGHHFPMEYEWYLANLFDADSVREFNREIEAGNPLEYNGLDEKIAEAKKKTGQKSGCMTFEARIEGIRVVVAMLLAGFRGGSVGAAEGEKFIRAVERAKKKHFPVLAYVHGTAGIRIQEGVNGVIQMPRCTMAVRNYIEAGGLYLVLYDTNSYAGPVASFLGCSPYQFSIRSANIGFAGPGVIKETTGVDIPPDYHQAHQALARGHIQGIWDRREARKNLYQALRTMGGRNLYYR